MGLRCRTVPGQAFLSQERCVIRIGDQISRWFSLCLVGIFTTLTFYLKKKKKAIFILEKKDNGSKSHSSWLYEMTWLLSHNNLHEIRTLHCPFYWGEPEAPRVTTLWEYRAVCVSHYISTGWSYWRPPDLTEARGRISYLIMF